MSEIKLNAARGQSRVTWLLVGSLYCLMYWFNKQIELCYLPCCKCADVLFVSWLAPTETSSEDLRFFIFFFLSLIAKKLSCVHECSIKASKLVHNKEGTNGNKCHQSQSLCFICNCNSITLPPRRPGICRRMSRSNSLRLVMVFSLRGK